MRASRTTSKPLIVSALMVMSLVSWLALPNHAHRNAPRVFADTGSSSASLAKPDKTTQARVNEAYGKLPLSFEANQGQFDSRVKFVSRGGGHTVYLTSSEAVLRLYARTEAARDKESAAISTDSWEPRAERNAARPTVLRMKLIGAAPAREVDGLDELPGTSNYFIGNDPKKWRTGVTSYSKVRYRSVYPGIDLVYHSDQRNLEYDFKVAPGANPGTIRLLFEGAERVRIDKNGELVLRTSGGEVRQHKPFVYQEAPGARKQIVARYVIRGKRQIGFRISRYETNKPLVIDPVLSYSTYLGGSRLDSANAVAVDASGNAYIVGSTTSADFPTANPFQPAINGSFTSDAFVTKLNAAGSALVYSTYLGGSLSDAARGIALDSGGNAYLTGETRSLDFPIANPFQSVLGGESDGFVTKLNPQGSGLVYSTYLGGIYDDLARAIAVDRFGGAYVTGNTISPDFPLANPLQPTMALTDAFVSRLDPSGTTLVYSTYLGGSGSDSATAIALDSDGNAYVTGGTGSFDFPTVNALQPNYIGQSLFKSTDSGASWAAVNNEVPRSATVWALAIDPLNTATVYAGTDIDGNYRSTDGGAHWVPASQGLPNYPILFDLAIDPKTPSTLYAGMYSSGIHKTTDAGASWNTINHLFLTTCLAIDKANPSTLYAGNFSRGVLVSTDGGQSFADTQFMFPQAHVVCLAVDPTSSGSFYVGTQNFGIHKHPRGGGPLPISSGQVRCVTVAAASPSTVYAGTGSGGIYKSTDAGGTWGPINTGLTENIIDAIAVDPINPLIVYAATASRSYKSTNGGDNWSPMTVNPRSSTLRVNEFAIDPSDPSVLYAAAFGAGEAYITKLNPSGSAIVYSTFFGGSGGDSFAGIAVDSSGAAYVVGTTTSLDLSNSPRPFAGSVDVMIAKISPDGKPPAFFTYLGGVGQDTARGISLDSVKNAWITGDTLSPDFPTTPDAIPLNPCSSGICRQAFVSRLNSTGSLLTYSTYLGAVTSLGFGISVDSTGSPYVVGQTFATDFPTTPGAFQVNFGGGTADGFVAKISDVPPFDLCLQDETTGARLQVNSTTGDYRFVTCSGVSLAGTSALTRRGCLITLQKNGPELRLLARIDTCINSGIASIQVFSQGTTFTILDRNTTNNTCACPR